MQTGYCNIYRICVSVIRVLSQINKTTQMAWDGKVQCEHVKICFPLFREKMEDFQFTGLRLTL